MNAAAIAENYYNKEKITANKITIKEQMTACKL